ncbi:MAG: pyridoxamine 5'-phosphate oxidase, partial [Maribacter sp.]|nr:pyridoxamine 5'-phosphate oxidase [Maribacter sp.]
VSQTRIKIWGTAYIDTNPSLITSVQDENYHAKIERAIVFKVKAWDVNCKQHIKQRFTVEEIKNITEPLESKIKTLEATIQQLKTNN